ncbi:MAG: hypothetical protein HY438_00065 [DPANN group archaeon]|nr:hypothetical protein [DPANN group archaeon]
MESIETKLIGMKNKIGLVRTRLNVSMPEDKTGIREYILPDWSEIVVQVGQDVNLVPDLKTKKYLERLAQGEPLEVLVSDLLYHGCGHRELPTETGLGCPHNAKNHDLILDGICQALQEKGKAGQSVSDADGNSRSLESYVANAFEDVLDNVSVRRHTRHAGQILFWNNQGFENKGKFGEFYEAFVKINLVLWGKPEDAGLLSRFYSNSGEVKKAVDLFTTYLKNSLRTDKLLGSFGREEIFTQLYDKSRWRDMAYQFTTALADLIKSQHGSGGEDGEEGQAGKGRQKLMPLCFGAPAGTESPFDKELKLPQVQEEIAHGRYVAGIGPSRHTEPLLQLDALYRKISRAISVKTSDYVQASAFPIAYFGRREPREGEQVKISRIKGVGINEDGQVGLRVARYSIDHPATHKIHPRNFPRLRVALLDTSDSMGEAADGGSVGDKSFIPWGDKSKYHYALMGLYGIDNFLERQGIAQFVKAEAITFSDSTRSSGRQALWSEAERRALLQMPSGGTSINTARLLEGLDDKCFLISISDGKIDGWGSISADYRKAVERAQYAHIHIGAQNSFTEDLKSWGVPVYFVKGNEDLSKIMINVASARYREVKK